MRTDLIAGAALAAGVFAASPAFAEPTVSPFVGYYLGVHAGYAYNTGRASIAPTPGTDLATLFVGASSPTSRSFRGGFYHGYNFMVAPAFLLGIESDISFGRLSATGTGNDGGQFNFLTYSYGVRNTVNWSSSLRARAGFTVQNLLVYATGGIAIADISAGATFNAAVTDLSGAVIRSTDQASFHRLKAGYTVGLGAEYALTSHWLVRGEYSFADFGKTTIQAPDGALKSAARLGTIRVGTAYKF